MLNKFLNIFKKMNSINKITFQINVYRCGAPIGAIFSLFPKQRLRLTYSAVVISPEIQDLLSPPTCLDLPSIRSEERPGGKE